MPGNRRGLISAGALGDEKDWLARSYLSDQSRRDGPDKDGTAPPEGADVE